MSLPIMPTDTGPFPNPSWASIFAAMLALAGTIYTAVNLRRISVVTLNAQSRNQDEEQRIANAAARAAEAQKDREQVSADMKWIVENLRDEVKDLRKQLMEERELREDLEKQVDQLRRELNRHGIPVPKSTSP